MHAMPRTAESEHGRAQEARPLTGNEAIARGAWEAGVAVAAAYPGTPSTEIFGISEDSLCNTMFRG